MLVGFLETMAALTKNSNQTIEKKLARTRWVSNPFCELRKHHELHILMFNAEKKTRNSSSQNVEPLSSWQKPAPELIFSVQRVYASHALEKHNFLDSKTPVCFFGVSPEMSYCTLLRGPHETSLRSKILS